MEGNHTETTRLFGVMMLNEVSSDGDETKLNISKRCDETVSPGLCKSYDAKSNVREPFFKRNVHERTVFEEVQQNAAYCCLQNFWKGFIKKKRMEIRNGG